MKPVKPVVLVILDGWGYSKNTFGNAIAAARKPNYDYLLNHYPHTLVGASGEDVGQPKGYQGNSEVGHLTIGTGRILWQSLERINRSIRDGSFYKNKSLLKAVAAAKKPGKTLHVMGLVQDQGVHAHQELLFALLNLAARQHVKRVVIHYIADGRDTLPKSTLRYLKALERSVAKATKKGVNVEYGTLSGRYFTMDRDTRWDRTKLAYDALVLGQSARRAPSIRQAITDAYAKGETDEFFKPTLIGNYSGMKDGDGVIWFNYRYDRTRQLTKALVEPSFTPFKRPANRPKIQYCAMTEYYKELPHAPRTSIAFPPLSTTRVLGEVISAKHLRQFRVAETEKYAHVTYFFNGEHEKPFWGEDRKLIPTLRIATYDLAPQLRAREIATALSRAAKSGKYAFCMANFANADLVGHTGKFKQTIQAIEAIDDALGVIYAAVKTAGGVLLITADHGNAEKKIAPDGSPLSAHTTSPVPFVLAAPTRPELQKGKITLKKGMGLQDVAPTILKLMSLPKPKEMTGTPLY